MIPNLNEICECCGGYENQPLLQLAGNKCFVIANGNETDGEFCLKEFAYPVDGHNCINLNATVSGEEITIFDNQLETLAPGDNLTSGKLYARGIMLKVTYPTTDINGEDIPYVDKSIQVITIDSALVETEYPLHNLFTIFTNPKSNDPEKVINKIKVYNPNTNYAVRISALVLFGEAQ